jgi:hypothetical protein
MRIRAPFPDWNFDPDPPALSPLSLPDINEVHVVATMVAAEANSVVTFNVAHFSHAARVEAPDAFLVAEVQTSKAHGSIAKV